jgi:hypothetical protein
MESATDLTLSALLSRTEPVIVFEGEALHAVLDLFERAMQPAGCADWSAIRGRRYIVGVLPLPSPSRFVDSQRWLGQALTRDWYAID